MLIIETFLIKIMSAKNFLEVDTCALQWHIAACKFLRTVAKDDHLDLENNLATV